jgi:hypothetical protein
VLWPAGNGNDNGGGGGGSVAGHGFGAHATLHERLFLFAGNAHAHASGPGPAPTPPPAVAVAHLDFNVHRIRRGVHERERRACAAGRDPQCDRKRGTCTGEGEGDEYGDGGGGGERDNGGGGGGGCFTVEDMGLLYRQTSIGLPDESDAFFGTDRIVRVMVRLFDQLPRYVVLMIRFCLFVFCLVFVQSLSQGSEAPDGGLVRRRVIIYPMTG